MSHFRLNRKFSNYSLVLFLFPIFFVVTHPTWNKTVPFRVQLAIKINHY